MELIGVTFGYKYNVEQGSMARFPMSLAYFPNFEHMEIGL
jgi:hypothetical protein